jgi:heptosyltransferase II
MDPKRIVVRGVNWLGDAVMSTPALLRLRQRYPASQITLVTPEKLNDLWREHPAVDQVISFSKSDNVLKTAKRIRASAAELSLIFPNSFRSALELSLAGIPVRIGYAGGGRSLLLSKRVPRPESHSTMRKRSEREVKEALAENRQPLVYQASAHHVYHYLGLVKAAGGSDFPLPPNLHVTASEEELFRNRRGIDPETYWIGINPGAEYGGAKRWPLENFAKTILQLRQRFCFGVILFGGAGDLELAHGIAREISRSTIPIRVILLTGSTTLRELCIGLKCCQLLLTNDTGPMHLAAAVGTTVAAIFGSTSPELTGPGEPGKTHHLVFRSSVPCTPCFLRECPVDFRCMRGITPESVADRLDKVLAKSSSSAVQ